MVSNGASALGKSFTYTYDAWGNFTLTPDPNAGANAGIIEKYNPVTYRGYYYDTDLEMYYLQSRYYNPRWGRFLSADDMLDPDASVLSANLYAYCANNPVNFTDNGGCFAEAVANNYLHYQEYAQVLYAAVMAGAANLWNPVGQAVLIGCGVTAIAIGGYYIYQYAKSETQDRATSVATTAAEAKVKIRNERNKYDYWIAVYVDFGDGYGTYIPTKGLSYAGAISYVRSGRDVFASSARTAKQLAIAAGNGRAPTWDPAHGTIGYHNHYHVKSSFNKRIGGHIFYI